MLHALDLLGCAILAVGGALAAGRKRLDLLGGVVLGAVTGISEHPRPHDSRGPGAGEGA